MTLNEIRDAAFANATSKGFWDGVETLSPDLIGSKLALIHSEVSEALEDARNGRMETWLNIKKREKPEGFPSELADIIIRVADLAGKLGIDLGKEVALKMVYNESRPFKHGKAF